MDKKIIFPVGENETAAAATTTVVSESDEIPDSFVCCICLELLFKPIVLCCGHICCFWCVHKSMSGLKESHCPICRHPYNHFPTVSQMLHFLLFKLCTAAYSNRQDQVLAEEKRQGLFSPQFSYPAFDHLKDHECPSSDSLKPCSTVKGKADGNHNPISITDVQCTACKQLLFHPVFLNCGHGYCETCISCSADNMLRCQVCNSLQPTGFPKVCLELDHFLEEQFPREYIMRRDDVLLKQENMKIENPTSCASVEASSAKASKKSFLFPSMLKEGFSRSKPHFGVGCDCCGMYPIIGDRYRCKDCVEEIGFDLCGDCYNTGSKHPGRFNQQHTPEHKFERVTRRIVE